MNVELKSATPQIRSEEVNPYTSQEAWYDYLIEERPRGGDCVADSRGDLRSIHRAESKGYVGPFVRLSRGGQASTLPQSIEPLVVNAAIAAVSRLTREGVRGYAIGHLRCGDFPDVGMVTLMHRGLLVAVIHDDRAYRGHELPELLGRLIESRNDILTRSNGLAVGSDQLSAPAYGHLPFHHLHRRALLVGGILGLSQQAVLFRIAGEMEARDLIAKEMKERFGSLGDDCHAYQDGEQIEFRFQPYFWDYVRLETVSYLYYHSHQSERDDGCIARVRSVLDQLGLHHPLAIRIESSDFEHRGETGTSYRAVALRCHVEDAPMVWEEIAKRRTLESPHRLMIPGYGGFLTPRTFT